MGCGDDCIKCLLFTFNFVFSLIGLALIVVGAVLLSNFGSFDEAIDIGGGAKTPLIFVIVIGGIIFVIAALGCCGAIRENKCMLITFAICLLVIFGLQMAIGIYSLTHKGDFKNEIEKGLRREFNKIGSDLAAKKLFDNLQAQWECCGVNGAQDYQPILHIVPPSCCVDKDDCRKRPFVYWEKGCAEVLTDFSGKSGVVIGGVAIALAVVEILGAVLALRLARRAQ